MDLDTQSSYTGGNTNSTQHSPITSSYNDSSPELANLLLDIRRGDWGTRHTPPTGILRNHYQEKSKYSKRDPYYNENPFGIIQRNSTTEPNLLQERREMVRRRNPNEPRSPIRLRGRDNCHQVRRYSPSPVGKLFSDDDTSPSRDSTGLLKTESQSSDESPNSSDRQFLMECSDICPSDNNSSLGTSGDWEDKLGNCPTTQSSTSESHGRSPPILTGYLHGNNIRRRLNNTPPPNESDTLGGPRSNPLNTLPIPYGNNSQEHTQDLYNQRSIWSLHACRRRSNKKTN